MQTTKFSDKSPRHVLAGKRRGGARREGRWVGSEGAASTPATLYNRVIITRARSVGIGVVLKEGTVCRVGILACANWRASKVACKRWAVVL